MAKRRTRKDKVRAKRSGTIIRNVKKASPEKELYFRQDFFRSLVIIGAILALEIGWWLLNR